MCVHTRVCTCVWLCTHMRTHSHKHTAHSILFYTLSSKSRTDFLLQFYLSQESQRWGLCRSSRLQTLELWKERSQKEGREGLTNEKDEAVNTSRFAFFPAPFQQVSCSFCEVLFSGRRDQCSSALFRIFVSKLLLRGIVDGEMG